MADEQKPGGSSAPPPGGAPAPKPPAAAGHATPPKAPATMAATPWEGELPQRLRDRFGSAISEGATYLGQNFLVAKPEAVVPIIEHLKLEEEFDYLVDITAVHWPKRPEQFDLVYILYSFARNQRIRIKTYIAEGYRPRTATVVHLGANWL
jgi:NADH-quinone oxidoreductase subunit C